jgi:rhodanese-related sulfurtransferase
LPYSRLELEALRLLPCRHTPLVLVDAGDGIAEKAAGRLSGLGYREIHVLEGGAPAWAAAGYTLFEGVNVPSKTFGELVEAELHTPHVTAQDLSRMMAEGAALVQLDGRPIEEYRRMTIPGARCCPNAELAHRLSLFAPDAMTPVVVSCAGRTRSIIGAQSLILAGAPNPVFALENGTQGWELADLTLEHGADRLYPETLDAGTLEASRQRGRTLIERCGLPVVEEAQLAAWTADETRSFYCLDVRTPEEFAAGHHPLASNAPGGQLVQATDKWIAVRNARIALLDDTGLRAAVTALWLRAMGHRPVIVTSPGAPGCWSASGTTTAASPVPLLPVIAPTDLKHNGAQVVDLRPSTAFRSAHLAGAVWSIRPRLAALSLDPARPVVLTATGPELAALAAVDLREMGHEAISFLLADEAAWKDTGLTLETGDGPAESEAIDFLDFVHDRHTGNKESMRGYLTWELGLIAQLDAQERAVFDLEPLKRHLST